MMFFATLKMMLLVSLAMMRCLPLCARRHTSFASAFIIGRSPHHLPKANTIQKTHLCLGRQKCVFCWWTRGELALDFCSANKPSGHTAASQKSSVTVRKTTAPGCFALCVRLPSMRGSKKARGCRWQPLAFLVDPRGVEPLSESPLIRLSPWAVCYLEFPICGVSRQTPRQGSHFMRDRFNGETPMHGHRSMTLGSRSRFSESNGQDRSLAALPN